MNVAFMLLSLAAVSAYPDTIEELNLTADCAINVPAAATTYIDRTTFDADGKALVALQGRAAFRR
jgi:hypothetical protein